MHEPIAARIAAVHPELLVSRSPLEIRPTTTQYAAFANRLGPTATVLMMLMQDTILGDSPHPVTVRHDELFLMAGVGTRHEKGAYKANNPGVKALDRMASHHAIRAHIIPGQPSVIELTWRTMTERMHSNVEAKIRRLRADRQDAGANNGR